MKNIYIDVKQTLGTDKFIYAGKEPYYKYIEGKRTDEVLGTAIIILDGALNKVKVKIPKIIENKFEPMDKIEFINLKGKVWGSSKKGSDFVELFISYTADDVNDVFVRG